MGYNNGLIMGYLESKHSLNINTLIIIMVILISTAFFAAQQYGPCDKAWSVSYDFVFRFW